MKCLVLILVSLSVTISTHALCQHREELTITFGFDSYEFDQQDSLVLQQARQLCSSREFYFFKVFAFADTVGNVSYNESLSMKRALAVENYLSRYVKLEEDNTYVHWLGESCEIYDLHFEEAHCQQRCVDILIYLKDQ